MQQPRSRAVRRRLLRNQFFRKFVMEIRNQHDFDYRDTASIQLSLCLLVRAAPQIERACAKCRLCIVQCSCEVRRLCAAQRSCAVQCFISMQRF
jgi:hypothetical protein